MLFIVSESMVAERKDAVYSPIATRHLVLATAELARREKKMNIITSLIINLKKKKKIFCE